MPGLLLEESKATKTDNLSSDYQHKHKIVREMSRSLHTKIGQFDFEGPVASVDVLLPESTIIGEGGLCRLALSTVSHLLEQHTHENQRSGFGWPRLHPCNVDVLVSSPTTLDCASSGERLNCWTISFGPKASKTYLIQKFSKSTSSSSSSSTTYKFDSLRSISSREQNCPEIELLGKTLEFTSVTFAVSEVEISILLKKSGPQHHDAFRKRNATQLSEKQATQVFIYRLVGPCCNIFINNELNTCTVYGLLKDQVETGIERIQEALKEIYEETLVIHDYAMTRMIAKRPLRYQANSPSHALGHNDLDIGVHIDPELLSEAEQLANKTFMTLKEICEAQECVLVELTLTYPKRLLVKGKRAHVEKGVEEAKTYLDSFSRAIDQHEISRDLTPHETRACELHEAKFYQLANLCACDFQFDLPSASSVERDGKVTIRAYPEMISKIRNAFEGLLQDLISN